MSPSNSATTGCAAAITPVSYTHLKMQKGTEIIMNMILKKRHIVLAALVLALGVAVYLNWAFSDAAKDFAVSGTGGDAGGKKYGDAQLVNGDGEDGAADADGYFSEARISRQKARDEAVATIQKVFADVEVDEEQRADVYKRQSKGSVVSLCKQPAVTDHQHTVETDLLIRKPLEKFLYSTGGNAGSFRCNGREYLGGIQHRCTIPFWETAYLKTSAVLKYVMRYRSAPQSGRHLRAG